MRKLILNLFASECDLEAALKKNEDYPQRFLHEMVMLLYQQKTEQARNTENQKEMGKVKGRNFWSERSRYHVNREELPITLD